MAGLGLQLLWVRLLSRQVPGPTALHWLPALALLLAVRFLWLNRRYRSLRIVVAGAGLNLLVMVGNGGLMPIAPSVAHALAVPHGRTGTALALSKDRLISDRAARLAPLDDRFVVAAAGLHIACSLGDLVVVMGCVMTLVEEIQCGKRDRSGRASNPVTV